MQFNQHGVTVSIDDDEVRRIVQERLNSDSQTRPPVSVPLFFSAAPRIGTVWAAMGGIYAGVCAGRDGAADCHLILGPEHEGETTWQPANDWANGLKLHGFSDFTLPYRAEQAVLFGNLRTQFKEAYYWSREQHAEGSSYAWGQNFGHGFQGHWRKDLKCRARAVRRLAI